MHTKNTLRELFAIAEETHKYGSIDSALISSVIIPQKEIIKKEPSYEEKERFNKLLNTPYGL